MSAEIVRLYFWDANKISSENICRGFRLFCSLEIEGKITWTKMEDKISKLSDSFEPQLEIERLKVCLNKALVSNEQEKAKIQELAAKHKNSKAMCSKLKEENVRWQTDLSNQKTELQAKIVGLEQRLASTLEEHEKEKTGLQKTLANREQALELTQQERDKWKLEITNQKQEFEKTVLALRQQLEKNHQTYEEETAKSKKCFTKFEQMLQSKSQQIDTAGEEKACFLEQITDLNKTIISLRQQLDNKNSSCKDENESTRNKIIMLEQALKSIEIEKENLIKDIDLQKSEIDKNVSIIKTEVEKYEQLENEMKKAQKEIKYLSKSLKQTQEISETWKNKAEVAEEHQTKLTHETMTLKAENEKLAANIKHIETMANQNKLGSEEKLTAAHILGVSKESGLDDVMSRCINKNVFKFLKKSVDESYGNIQLLEKLPANLKEPVIVICVKRISAIFDIQKLLNNGDLFIAGILYVHLVQENSLLSLVKSTEVYFKSPPIVDIEFSLHQGICRVSDEGREILMNLFGISITNTESS